MADSDPDIDPDSDLGADPSRGQESNTRHDPESSPAESSWRRDESLLGWVGAIVIASVAFFLRRWHSGTPRLFAFDETYYAKDAWSLLNHGYIRAYVEGADQTILNGQPDGLWQDVPSMVVHPPVGTWLIALGEKALGMDPVGWRIAPAVVGALMVLVFCRFLRRVTGSTVLGLLGGLLMTFDGLHLVLSRLALLDIFLAFFILCGVHCVVADRQWLEARLAAGHSHAWWRPWLLLGGISFGLACGTKWSGVYALAAFGVMAYAWSAGARRKSGEGMGWLQATWQATWKDGIPAFASLVLVAFCVYVVSWTGWLMHAKDYEQAYSNTQYTTYDGGKQWPTATEDDASGLGEVTQSLRSLWSYHRDVYTFHTHFLNDKTHPYMSKPTGWLVLSRPVGVDAQLDIPPGQDGCAAPTGSTCLRQITLLGNPAIWWTGTAALLLSLVMWGVARDWRYGVPVVGVAATWLPWFTYDDRPIFSWYAITCLPFIILAIVLALRLVFGQAPVPRWRRALGIAITSVYLVIVIGLLWFFWPILTDGLLTHDQWMSRMWFERWI